MIPIIAWVPIASTSKYDLENLILAAMVIVPVLVVLFIHEDKPQPLFWGLDWHRKVSLALFSLAMAVPFMTFSLNSIDDKKAIRITPNDIYQVSGNWAWRYFKWGVFYGGKHTQFNYFLNDMGLPLSTAKILDIFNPTPFIITLGLLSASGIAAVRRPQKLSDQPASSKQ